jgi:hypothetical protein
MSRISQHASCWHRLAATAGLGACLLVLAFLMPAGAQASTYLPACNFAPTQGLCLNDANGHSNGGNPIIMYKQDPDASQDLVANFDGTPCGYTAIVVYNASDPSKDCPFSDDQLDKNYQGDSIETLNFDDVGSNSCLGTPGSSEVAALEGCSTDGNYVAWVADCANAVQCSGGGTPQWAFVNVYWTNEEGTPQVLNGNNTSGTQATLDKWVDGDFQLWEGNGL